MPVTSEALLQTDKLRGIIISHCLRRSDAGNLINRDNSNRRKWRSTDDIQCQIWDCALLFIVGVCVEVVFAGEGGVSSVIVSRLQAKPRRSAGYVRALDRVVLWPTSVAMLANEYIKAHPHGQKGAAYEPLKPRLV